MRNFATIPVTLVEDLQLERPVMLLPCVLQGSISWLGIEDATPCNLSSRRRTLSLKNVKDSGNPRMLLSAEETGFALP